MNFLQRLKHGWDAFRNRDPTKVDIYDQGPAYSRNPNAVRLTINNERSIIASIYNRIAIDCAAISIKHVRVDQNGNFEEEIDDDFNKCLTVSPNLDQTPRAFFQDIYLCCFDEGNVAIFPAACDLDPIDTGSYKIYELRRAKIRGWYPKSLLLEAYNPDTAQIQNLIMPKELVAVVENPLYTVMNGPNSTLQRLISKLNILDAIDRQSGSGKMDLVIQLPYSLHSDLKRVEAEKRRKQIEMQLTDSKYGIAYIDATERITQLNRSIENNLLTQIEYLTNQVYSQLGVTPGVMDGTASEQEMTNYNSRTIEPMVSAVSSEMNRKFLTKTARSQGQAVTYFRNPFKLVPTSNLAEMADKLIRNTILTPNEFRAILGYRPADDEQANQLSNPNIAAAKQPNAEEPALPKEGEDEE